MPVVLLSLKGRSVKSHAFVADPGLPFSLQGTKAAAALAGLNVMRFINEPTAAALAFRCAPNTERHGIYLLQFLRLAPSLHFRQRCVCSSRAHTTAQFYTPVGDMLCNAPANAG